MSRLPFLGRRAHRSLAWLSHPLLALLLLGVSLVLLLGSVAHLVSDAKEALEASCRGVEGAANVMVSLPHYMADGVNDLNRRSVAAVVDGTAEVLDLGLEGVEGIALLVIDLYRSLFLCLLNLAVHGSLDLLIAGTEEAQLFVTGAFQAARIEIQGAVGDINSGLAASIKTLNMIPGVHIAAPQSAVPALASLSNVSIPSTVLSSLLALNSSLPTLASLRSSLDAVISTPIEALRANVKASLANATISIAALPVPPTSSVEFCNGLDTGFVDDIGRELVKFVKIAIGVLLGFVALLIGIAIIYEDYRYRSHLAGIVRAKHSWESDLGNGANPADSLSLSNLRSFLSAASHPTLAMILTKLANVLRLGPEQRARLHWFGAYIFHPPAVIFLVLGVLGLLTIQLELLVLNGSIRHTVAGQAQAGLSNFGAQVQGIVNGNMNATSFKYANETNTVILGVQTGINHDLFGWVNATTTTMNNTIVAFYDGLTSTINSTLASTPLQKSALDLVGCLLGGKLLALSKALTVLNGLHVTLPLVSPSVLLLSPNRTNELVSSISGNSSSTAPTGADAVVARMLDRYEESLKTQRLGFVVCIGLWLVVLLMGVVGALYREKDEQETLEPKLKALLLSPPGDSILLSTWTKPASAPVQYSTPWRPLFPSQRSSQRPSAPTPPVMSQTPTLKPLLLPRSIPVPPLPLRQPVPSGELKFKIAVPKPERKRDSETMGLSSGSYSTRRFATGTTSRLAGAGSTLSAVGSKMVQLMRGGEGGRDDYRGERLVEQDEGEDHYDPFLSSTSQHPLTYPSPAVSTPSSSRRLI